MRVYAIGFNVYRAMPAHTSELPEACGKAVAGKGDPHDRHDQGSVEQSELKANARP